MALPPATEYQLFEEFMVEAKGKMFVCIDKGYPYLKEVMAVIEKTGTAKQVLFNGTKNLKTNRNDYGMLLERINFKPVVSLNQASSSSEAMEYADSLRPQVMELVFESDRSPYLQNSQLLTSKKIKLWYNALWPALCAGHDDDLAAEENNPANSWD